MEKKDITIFSKDQNGETNESFIEGSTHGNNLIKELNRYIPTKKTVLKKNHMDLSVCQFERIDSSEYNYDI